MENNNLRFHEKPEQQKMYRTVEYKAALDMADTGEDVSKKGRKFMLPSSYTYGKRWYSERYYDCNRYRTFDIMICLN
jgi:hypothetical protein